MKNYPTKIIKLISTTFVLFLFFSCASDADLLADFIIEDAIVTETTIDPENASIVVEEDKAVSFNMLNNAASKGSKKRYKSSKQPLNGGLVIQKDSIAIYTPDYDFNGKDTIEITLEVTNEDNSTSDVPLMVDVIVKPTVDVVEDKVETEKGSSLLIEPLKNDKFRPESGVVVSNTTTPSKGTAVLNDDNTITYTPNIGAVGIDLFSYTTKIINLDESETTETGNITVTINGSGSSQANAGPMGPLKAFPGAEGFGKNTTGGRGGAIVEVTNLNDSGSGSLRAALLLTYPRTIVFKVGGIINLTSGNLNIPRGSGNVTIAGQTAPGDGICIKGDVLEIKDSNVILRHFRIRGGDNIDNKNKTNLRIVSTGGGIVSDVIADHLSISWGADTNVSIGGIGSGNSVNNVTIQNSIISENITNGYNILLWNRSTNITFFGNLLAHSTARNVRSSTSTSNFEQVNNLLYSNKSNVNPTDENYFDIVGNVWITNPSVPTSNEIVRLEPCSSSNCPGGADRKLTKAYIHDNTLDGGAITISSNLNPYIQNAPLFNSGLSYMPSSQVKDFVLTKAGANLYRDSYDKQIINEVLNRNGGRNTSAPSNIYPNLSAGTPYIDIDSDGIDDSWETANGLNANDASDGKKDREYLHFLTIQ
jgi:hypothetical protein